MQNLILHGIIIQATNSKGGGKMKVSTSTHNILTRFGMRKAFDIIADAGFEAIDYGMFHLSPNKEVFTKYSDKRFSNYFRDVKKEASARGLEICQCHAPFPLKVYDEEKDTVLLECAKKSIYAAAYMECPNIVIHPAMKGSFRHGRNYNECRRTNFEFYSAMVPALRETGVTLCIENMFAGDGEQGKLVATTCSRSEWMIDFIDGLNEIHGGNMFAACLDTGHANISGSGASDMALELRNRLKILHIHDCDGLTDMHQAPGFGKINWREFISALREIGYSGTLSFEADSFFGQWANNELYGEAVCRALAKTLYTIGRNFADLIENNNK